MKKESIWDMLENSILDTKNEKDTEQIRITFYKDSGKYYTSCVIGTDKQIFEDDFKQEIVNKQDALMEGWQGEFYVVITEGDKDNRNFYERLYKKHEFIGINKEENK